MNLRFLLPYRLLRHLLPDSFKYWLRTLGWFRWLQENMALNGLTARVTVENLAVTDGSQPMVQLNAPAYYSVKADFSVWPDLRNTLLAGYVGL